MLAVCGLYLFGDRLHFSPVWGVAELFWDLSYIVFSLYCLLSHYFGRIFSFAAGDLLGYPCPSVVPDSTTLYLILFNSALPFSRKSSSSTSSTSLFCSLNACCRFLRARWASTKELDHFYGELNLVLSAVFGSTFQLGERGDGLLWYMLFPALLAFTVRGLALPSALNLNLSRHIDLPYNRFASVSCLRSVRGALVLP